MESVNSTKKKFNDLTGLSRWVKVFLYLQVVVCIAALLSAMVEYRMFTDIRDDVLVSQELAMEAAEANDARQSVIGIAQIAIFIFSGAIILRWIYLANYNVRQLGAENLKFTPGWAIGGYFIPILNLWMPYMAMKEIWKASSDPLNWESRRASVLLPSWWFLWLASNALSNLYFRLSHRATGVDQAITANIVGQISDFVEIALALALMAIIARVNDMQLGRIEYNVYKQSSSYKEVSA